MRAAALVWAGGGCIGMLALAPRGFYAGTACFAPFGHTLTGDAKVGKSKTIMWLTNASSPKTREMLDCG